MRKYTEAELLSFIANNPEILPECMSGDTIDLDSVRKHMEQQEKRKAVCLYIDKIKKMKGNDDRYYINLPDPTKAGGRIKIRDRTIDGMIDKIYAWHVRQHDIDDGDPTVATLYIGYKDHKIKTSWSISTQKRNQSIWDNIYDGSEITNRPITDITLPDLEEWAYGLIKSEGLTRKGWARVSGIMRGVFEFAEIHGIIDRNPYRLLKIQSKGVFRQPEEKPPEEYVLSPEQELRLYGLCWQKYEAAAYPVHRLIPLAVIFLYQTGIRPCEVCSIRREDINEGYLTVKRYFSEKANVVLEDHTKAGHGSRRILITSLADSVLQAVDDYRREHGIDNPYLFQTGDSMLEFYNRLRKTLPILCKATGIPRNTPYSGRRTFISSCIDSGMNLKTVQEYVGHLDSRTTLNHYNYDRSTTEQKREALEKARNLDSLDSNHGH